MFLRLIQEFSHFLKSKKSMFSKVFSVTFPVSFFHQIISRHSRRKLLPPRLGTFLGRLQRVGLFQGGQL